MDLESFELSCIYRSTNNDGSNTRRRTARYITSRFQVRGSGVSSDADLLVAKYADGWEAVRAVFILQSWLSYRPRVHVSRRGPAGKSSSGTYPRIDTKGSPPVALSDRAI